MSIVITTTINLLMSEEFSQEEVDQAEEQCCCNNSCPKSFVLVMNLALHVFQLHELKPFFSLILWLKFNVQIIVE